MAFEDLVSSCLLEIDSFLGSYVDSYWGPCILQPTCMNCTFFHTYFIRQLILRHIYNLKSDSYCFFILFFLILFITILFYFYKKSNQQLR
jgi:hypothetical protein